MDKLQVDPGEYTPIVLLRNTKSDAEKMERVKTEMQKRGMFMLVYTQKKMVRWNERANIY